MLADYDEAPGWPAEATPVVVDPASPDRWMELFPARARRVECREAHRKWLAQPGNLERKRAAHRAWRQAQKEAA